MRRSRTTCALAIAIVLSFAGLTAARDWLHNHSGLAERPDCPACQVQRATGVTTPITAALMAIPVLIALGVVPALPAAGVVSGLYSLEPPPRSPPFPA
jgi:hypothetical protein